MHTDVASSSSRLITAALLSGLLGVVACGGGSGGGDSGGRQGDPSTISGTAAAGAPIIGNVTVKDSSTPARTRTGKIRVDGTYTLDVSDLTPPFMLRASGTVAGRGYSLFSAGVAADVNGTVNITPLTDLIVANVAGDLAARYFESGDFSVFTAEQISEKEQTLRTQLVPILEAVGLETSIDLLRQSFAADHSGLDAVLDLVDVEYDASTLVATVRNVLNDDSFTSDLGAGTVSGDALDPGDALTTTVSALQSISSRLAALADLYATRPPTEEEIRDLNLFDPDAFLHDGMTWDELLADLTDDVPVGIRLSSARIDAVSGDTITASFDWIYEGQVVDTSTFEFRKDSTTGLLLAVGNQRQFGAYLDTHANYHPDGADAGIFTGYLVSIEDPQGLLGDYESPTAGGRAVLTGPGGVNRTFFKTFQFDRFTQDLAHDIPTVWLEDAAIDQVPDTNAVYTVTIFDGATEVASYELVARKRPAKKSELSSRSFVQPATRSPASLAGFSGGTITVTWTVPESLSAPSWFVVLTSAGHYEWIDGNVSASGTTGTAVVPSLGWSATGGFSYVGATDVFGREYETRLYR